MWELQNIELRPAELDFSSAGLSRRTVTQLFADSLLIANAVELIDWEHDVQLMVCESCGTTNCEPGGWVSIRRAGECIVLGPAKRMFEGDKDDRQEYRPPDYVGKLGWPYMSLATYVALQARIPDLLDASRIRPLEQRDAVAILQWEAPARVLGSPFERPALRSDLLIACSEADVLVESERLSRVIESWANANGAVRLEPIRPDDIRVEFYVDIGGTPAWSPLVVRDGVPSLRLGTGLIAVVDATTPVESR